MISFFNDLGESGLVVKSSFVLHPLLVLQNVIGVKLVNVFNFDAVRYIDNILFLLLCVIANFGLLRGGKLSIKHLFLPHAKSISGVISHNVVDVTLAQSIVTTFVTDDPIIRWELPVVKNVIKSRWPRLKLRNKRLPVGVDLSVRLMNFSLLKLPGRKVPDFV